jgi:hypothetical protein
MFRGPQEPDCQASVVRRSQSFQFVFQPELFFFQGCNAEFVPRGMRHFSFDKFLDSLMFVCDFSYV